MITSVISEIVRSDVTSFRVNYRIHKVGDLMDLAALGLTIVNRCCSNVED